MSNHILTNLLMDLHRLAADLNLRELKSTREINRITDGVGFHGDPLVVDNPIGKRDTYHYCAEQIQKLIAQYTDDPDTSERLNTLTNQIADYRTCLDRIQDTITEGIRYAETAAGLFEAIQEETERGLGTRPSEYSTFQEETP